HDESTFRSGEVSNKRWFFGEVAPFYSKGRGLSNMASDFLVQHSSGPFFQLNEKEYEKAVSKYPQLKTSTGVDYVERSATASINVGQNAYFDNSTILEQFERLFMLIEFKEAYRNHTIEIVVDNARTHTAKAYSVMDFAKGIGTRVPVGQLEYIDANGQQQIVEYCFQDGPNKGLAKGLLELSKELKVILPAKPKLPDIRQALARHPVFQNVS
ncbi:unnamed protein product, partial [Didymodactylos carnosus]